MMIEVCKTEKDLYIPIGLWLRPLFYGLYSNRIHDNAIQSNNETQELNMFCMKGTLRWLGV
jgi:hypothetical protein